MTITAYCKNYIDKHIIPNIGKIKLNKLKEDGGLFGNIFDKMLLSCCPV